MAYDPVLDRVILRLSDVDVLTFRALVCGLFVCGGLGSGKSSTILFQLAMSMLLFDPKKHWRPAGLLVLCVKPNEASRWVEFARLAHRSADVILFNSASGLSFDFLQYMRSYGAHNETIVETFTDVMAVGKVYQPSSGEQYFENAVQELLRAALTVITCANEPLSLVILHQLISSLPAEGQINSPEWQTSECSRIIDVVLKRNSELTTSQKDDLDIAVVHLLQKWGALDDRTRSNIESTWSGLSSRFLYDPLRSMFCSGRFDFTPEQITHENKILIVDLSVLAHGRQTARAAQILIKTVFQRSWMRHVYKRGCCNGAAIFEDEFSFLLSRNSDPYFHMVCRDFGVAPIVAVQNICSMAAEEFGEQSPGSKTHGFLGLFGTKVFMANSEHFSNQYASDLIGKEFRYLDSWSASQGEHHQHTGISGNKQLVHIVEPIEFTRLMKPDGDNPIAEAIVHTTGDSFKATKSQNNPRGLPYLRVHFSR
jgi:hypothetical protein